MGDLPFFTIGHSTRTIEEFAAILQSVGVATIIDVRTVPRSRTNPQYDKAALPRAGSGTSLETMWNTPSPAASR